MQQLKQRERAGLVLPQADAEVGLVEHAADPHDLAADGGDEHQLFFQIAAVIGEAAGEDVGIAAEEGRLVFGDHATQPIGIDDLEIGQMADDFERGPLARNGACDE